MKNIEVVVNEVNYIDNWCTYKITFLFVSFSLWPNAQNDSSDKILTFITFDLCFLSKGKKKKKIIFHGVSTDSRENTCSSLSYRFLLWKPNTSAYYFKTKSGPSEWQASKEINLESNGTDSSVGPTSNILTAGNKLLMLFGNTFMCLVWEETLKLPVWPKYPW